MLHNGHLEKTARRSLLFFFFFFLWQYHLNDVCIIVPSNPEHPHSRTPPQGFEFVGKPSRIAECRWGEPIGRSCAVCNVHNRSYPGEWLVRIYVRGADVCTSVAHGKRRVF